MSLDMGVYTELFLPGKYRNNVVVDSNGYGEYDINIIQNASITGTFNNVAGKVEKGADRAAGYLSAASVSRIAARRASARAGSLGQTVLIFS